MTSARVTCVDARCRRESVNWRRPRSRLRQSWKTGEG